MRSSPLLLKDFFTIHLYFSAQPDFDRTKLPTEGLSPSSLDVHIREGVEAPRQRNYQIAISLKDEAKETFPYDFSIALVGTFEVIPEWGENQVDALFSANAPALLYSAARDTLALITGQGPYPKIILPSVTFVKPSSEQGNEGEKRELEPPKAIRKRSSRPRRRRAENISEESGT